MESYFQTSEWQQRRATDTRNASAGNAPYNCTLPRFFGRNVGRERTEKFHFYPTPFIRSSQNETLSKTFKEVYSQGVANLAFMAYRNKTYVAFASEDIHAYRLMQAWRAHDHIDFDFFDAHDINTALDTSKPETIRTRLRERLLNAKQVVVLVSETTKPKGARPSSFLYYEIETIAKLGLPVVFANLNQSRAVQSSKLPTTLADRYTMSVSFQPKIIQYALDEYISDFVTNQTSLKPKSGPYYYKESVYAGLGL